MAIGTEVIGTGPSKGTGWAIANGQRTLAGNVASARRVSQFLKKDIKVSADIAPLYAYLESAKGLKPTVGDASFWHLESDMLPISVEVNGAISSTSETAIVLTDGHTKRVKAGSVLKVERTGEMMLVTAVTDATHTLTVERDFAGTTAYALLDDEEIAIIGSAYADGTTAPDGMHSEPSIVTNYTQIFRTSFALSGRDIAGEVYGQPEQSRVQEDALENHALNVEMAFLFNNGLQAPTSSVVGVTGGFLYWVTTNVTNVGGALTETAFVDDLYRWLRRNQKAGNNLIMFVGENVNKALDSWIRDGLQYRPDDSMLGASCASYQTSAGPTVKIKKHGLLSVLGSGVSAANKGRQGMYFGMNLAHIGKATFKGRGRTLRANIETPGTDGKKWEYLEDVGLWLASEKTQCFGYGVTA